MDSKREEREINEALREQEMADDIEQRFRQIVAEDDRPRPQQPTTQFNQNTVDDQDNENTTTNNRFYRQQVINAKKIDVDDMVQLVQLSNANYIKHINRFNTVHN